MFLLLLRSVCLWFGQIIALLAKYHRKKVPSSKDGDFAMLPEEVKKILLADFAL